jgi:monofunctional biosynthetic peptidoglycan transglycosylase
MPGKKRARLFNPGGWLQGIFPAQGWFWSRLARFRRWMLLAALLAALLPVAAIVVFRWFPVPLSSFMLIRHVQSLVAERTVPPLHYHWVALKDISPLMALAVIAAEDQRFPDHRGLDFQAIRRAIDFNSRQSRTVRGASTITQQTAKNLFLWSDRSLVRKGIEAVLTLCIEALWEKRRILEVYLNIAEFGDGIYGVHAASRHFFAVNPSQLTRRQAALLAAVLPNPRRLLVDRPSSFLLGRVRWIETHMVRLGGVRFLDRLGGIERR